LTNPSDRVTAIYDLIERMKSVWRAETSYRIFYCFLYILLLWKRFDEEKTAPVEYKGEQPPSCS
ncbi:hypothetical protein GQ43DRAFT_383427, partial [Delitschia confertaspora ATCC 74209]